MEHRKKYSILLLAIFSFSSIYAMIIPQTNSSTRENENIANLDERQNNLQTPDIIEEEKNLVQPNSAAYYRDIAMNYSTIIYPAMLPGFHDLCNIKASTQNATHLFLTGYTNGTDGNRTLFVIVINKASNVIIKSLTWRGNTTEINETKSTVGLTIALDESTNQLIVGGYYDLYNSTQLEYETSGSGLLIAFSTFTWQVQWVKLIGLNSGFDVGEISLDPFFKPWHYGGERIEDIMIEANRSILITGSYSIETANWRPPPYENYYSINAFWARLNTTDGSVIWQRVEGKAVQESGDFFTYFASVGKKIIFNPVSKTYFILAHEKTYISGGEYDTRGTFRPYLIPFSIENGQKLIDYPLYIIFNSANYFSEYRMVDYIAMDSTGTMWAYGEYRSLVDKKIRTTRPMLYKIDPNGVVQIYETKEFQNVNYTAKGIIIDQNDTMYLFGGKVSNSTGNTLEVYMNMYDIYRTDAPLFTIEENSNVLSSNASIQTSIYDNNSRNIYLFGLNLGDKGGRFLKYGSGTELTIGQFTPLASYANSIYINLKWTQPDPRARYYYLYRSTEPITSQFISQHNPIQKLELNSFYLDEVNKDYDGVMIHYALVTGNDFMNSSSFSVTNTTIYFSPRTPILSLNATRTYILKDSWLRFFTPPNLPIENATLKLYGKIGGFSIAQLSTMEPLFTTSSSNWLDTSIQLTELGVWYFLVAAENDTRGNSYSSIKTINVEDLPRSPSEFTIKAIKAQDGEVSLNWTTTPGSRYNIYYRQGTDFPTNTIEGIYNATLANLLPLSSTDKTITYNITGLGSGKYYFVIHGVNSTGNATSLSPSRSATFNIVPKQPEVFSETFFNQDGINKISWTISPEASNYSLYRVYAPNDPYLCETNTSRMELIFTTETDTSKTDIVKADGYYYYVVVASNKNGNRTIDCKLAAIVRVALPEDNGNGLFLGLLIGGSIFGAVMIGWYAFKKNNPF
jgi:hypothetical protein